MIRIPKKEIIQGMVSLPTESWTNSCFLNGNLLLDLDISFKVMQISKSELEEKPEQISNNSAYASMSHDNLTKIPKYIEENYLEKETLAEIKNDKKIGIVPQTRTFGKLFMSRFLVRNTMQHFRLNNGVYWGGCSVYGDARHMYRNQHYNTRPIGPYTCTSDYAEYYYNLHKPDGRRGVGFGGENAPPPFNTPYIRIFSNRWW